MLGSGGETGFHFSSLSPPRLAWSDSKHTRDAVHELSGQHWDAWLHLQADRKV